MTRMYANGARSSRILGTTYVAAEDFAKVLEDVAAHATGVEQPNMLKLAAALRAMASAPIPEHGAGGRN